LPSRLGRNIAFNLSGQLLLVALSLVAVKFVFRQLGADSLAIVLASLTLAAILSATLDLGISSLTVREVSAHATNDPDYVRRLIGTASLFYWLTFIGLAFVVYVLAPSIVDRWIHLETLDGAVATKTLRVLGIASLTSLPRSLYTSVLRGLERMEFNNAIDVAVTGLQQLGTLAILAFGGGLLDIAYWFAVCFAAGIVAYVGVAARFLGWRALSPNFAAEVIHRNRAYATSMFIVSAVAPIHLQADRLLVSKLLPFASFGFYTTASRLVGVGTLPAAAISQAALPSFSWLARSNDSAELTSQYRKLQALLCFGAVVVLAAIAFSALPLMSVVFNREVSNTLFLPTLVLCTGFFLNTTVQLPYMVALAMGRTVIVARTNVFGLFFVLPAAAALTYFLGLVGAAMTLVVLDIWIYAYMMPRVCAECLRIPVWSWYGQVARILVLAAATYGIGLLLATTAGSGSVAALLVGFVAATLAYLLIAGRRLRLIRVLLKNPGEFRTRLAKDLEILSDLLLQGAPPYEASDWETLVDDMEQQYVEARRVLGEPALESIESEVSSALAASQSGRPLSPKYNADFGLARCAYLVCRLLRPTLVVETGVANGVTSAFILRALAENGHGTLHSIDLPPLGGVSDRAVGKLIPNRLRGRWQLHVGSSRRELPNVVDGKAVDVFLHDSVHTYRTMSWEFATVWPRLKSGGVLLSDDVQDNKAFEEMKERGVGFWRVVRQQDKPVLFGIAVKR
jgi:O-antigen/teichoic acid export membrane protein